MNFEQVLQLIKGYRGKEHLIHVDSKDEKMEIKKDNDSTFQDFSTVQFAGWNYLKWKRAVMHFFVIDENKMMSIDWKTKTIKLGKQATREHSQIHLKRSPPRATNLQIERAIQRLNGFTLKLSENKYAVTNREDANIQGHGFDFNDKRALLKAQLEYIERMAATVDLPKQVVASKEELGDKAIDPSFLGLPEMPIGKVQPFKDDLKIEWVRADALWKEKSLLMPSQYVQYLKPVKDNRFVYDNSSGCAVGSSYQESAFYSILESIERDVFMRFWFRSSQSPLYKIKFDSESQQLKEKYFEKKGYELHFYLVNDQAPVPVIWCLLRAFSEHASIYSITGLGCHVNVESAMNAAFSEVYNCYIGYKDKDLIDHPLLTSLEKPEDHLWYFASKQAKEVLEDKTSNQQVLEESDLRSRFPIRHVIDFDDFLRVLKEWEEYQDILIVDQTTEVTSQVGLVATKSFLLGGLPLDFSSHTVRVSQIAPNSTKQKEKNIHPLA